MAVDFLLHLPARSDYKRAVGSDKPSGRSSGVEHNLAKVGVVSSNLIARSSFPYDRSAFRLGFPGPFCCLAAGNHAGSMSPPAHISVACSAIAPVLLQHFDLVSIGVLHEEKASQQRALALKGDDIARRQSVSLERACSASRSSTAPPDDHSRRPDRKVPSVLY